MQLFNDYLISPWYNYSMTMKRKVNYFLLCEEFTYDDLDRVTISRIFNSVSAAGYPVKPTKFTLAFSVYLNDKDLEKKTSDLKIALEDDKGGIGLVAETTTPIEKSKRTIVTMLDLSNEISFPRKGSYKARLYVNDEEVDQLIFKVEDER